MKPTQALFETTVGFILFMVAVIIILLVRDAPVRVVTLAGIVVTIALTLAGWILTAEDVEEDDWIEGWRF